MCVQEQRCPTQVLLKRLFWATPLSPTPPPPPPSSTNSTSPIPPPPPSPPLLVVVFSICHQRGRGWSVRMSPQRAAVVLTVTRRHPRRRRQWRRDQRSARMRQSSFRAPQQHPSFIRPTAMQQCRLCSGQIRRNWCRWPAAGAGTGAHPSTGQKHRNLCPKERGRIS